MASIVEWARGYAHQAEVDLQTYDLLAKHAAPECHQSQFLQMVCEKLCKSHLFRGGALPDSLRGSHVYVAGTLPVILNKTYSLLKPNAEKGAWAVQHIKYISVEIQVLAPAVRSAGANERKDNCEYPWEDESGALHVPCDWQFHSTGLLDCAAGRLFMTLVRLALARLLD